MRSDRAYVAFEGSATPKNTVVTEFGWKTAAVSQSVQAQNLQLAYTAFKEATYVKNAYWLNIQDIPEANQTFGLQTGGSASDQYLGVHKPSFSSYQQYAVNWPTTVSYQTADAGPAIVFFNGTAYVGWTGTNSAHNLNLMTYNAPTRSLVPPSADRYHPSGFRTKSDGI